MRQASLWSGPYRLNVLDEEEPAKQDFGSQLTPAACLAPDGPLRGVAPGSLTRWLGVPWHTDEASCLSDLEYRPWTYLSMPSYWGARVPNQVLSAQAWSRATDEAGPAVQRMKHLAYREDWTRDINGRDYYERIFNMVQKWSTLGLLLPQDTPSHLRDLGLPGCVHVEIGRHPANPEKVELMAVIEHLNSPQPAPAADAILGVAPPPAPPRKAYGRGEV